jgi:uncharacterized protein (UPF0332 family)
LKKSCANLTICVFPCLLKGIDHKKHSGVISDFRFYFIKTKIFDINLSDIITGLFDTRSQSDYNDFYVISYEDIITQLENARIFEKEIDAYLKDK